MKHILLFLITNIAVLVVLGGVLRLLNARGVGLDYRLEERITALRVGA